MTTRILTVLMLALAASGCAVGSAYVARGDRYGGELVMTGGYQVSIVEAQAVMAEHCRGHFYVVGPESVPGAPERLEFPTREQDRAEFVCSDRTRPATVRAATLAAERSRLEPVSAAPRASSDPQLLASPIP